MSKKTKAAAKVKRSGEKRARKASQKAQYAAWRDSGVTKGSKRQRNTRSNGVALVKVKKGPSGKKPFPVHLWLDKSGKLLPGSPHRAWLELNRQSA